MNATDRNRRWSRAMLRRLLTRHRIGIGARILVVGFAHGPLGYWLSRFGFSVCELDASPQNVLQARREHPNLKSDHWRSGEPLPLEPDEQFDLVLVREREELRQNAFCPRVTLLVADLLSLLRPGGALVFADGYHPSGELTGHQPDCLAYMLSGFPGSVTRKQFRRSLWSPRTWWSVMTSGRRGRRHMVSLTIPEANHDRTFWRRQGARISQSGMLCCHAARTPAAAGNRRAA